MGVPLRVLIVEDSADDAELVLRHLRRAGYDPRFERVETEDALKAALEREAWDVVVSDYSLPRFDAPSALHCLKESGLDIPFIVVSGAIGEDTAVATLQAGARDFMLKQNLSRLAPAVQRELQQAQERVQKRLSKRANEQLQIEREELLEQLKQQNEDLLALTQMTANAACTLDLDEMLRVLLARVTEVMKADTVTVLFAEDGLLRVVGRAGVGDEDFSPAVTAVGEGFAGSIASRMEPAYVEDAAVDPLSAPLTLELGIRSRLGVPLKNHGVLIGVLHVGWLTVRPRRDREVHLLEVTADRCAAAVQNARLHRQVSKLSRVVEQSPSSVVITDLEGAIEYVNPTFCRLTGYTAEEVLGQNPRILQSGITAKEVYQDLWATLTAEQVWRGELHNRKKNGETAVELTVIAPVIDSDGRSTHYVALSEDVTRRKKAEREADESRLRFEQLAQHIDEVFWMTDVKKVERLYVSPAYERIWGQTCASLMASPQAWLDTVHPEDRERALHACLTDHARGAYDIEYRIVRPDGAIRWIHDRAFPVKDEAGEVYRIVGVASDITAAKQSHDALQSSLREKEALLKEVHHRVKNNLQVIISLLRLQTGRSPDSDTRDVLHEMQGRIQAMALLHEMLYRSGTFASVDLGGYLKQLANQSFRTLCARPNSIQLELDLASPRVEMDQAIPCGLLVNELISNGLKHGFPGDRGGRIRVTLEATDGQVRMSVADTGVGLPADFERRRTSSLGLQLASDLSRQLGGRLDVDRGLGSGASFSVAWAPRAVRH